MKTCILLWNVISVCGNLMQGYSCVIDVHFENKESGFFIKHSAGGGSSSSSRQQQQQQWQTDLDGVVVNTDESSVLSTDRFTVFHNSHPISVRAVYGPFSTKQTVPARYIVPDPPFPPSPTATNSSAWNESVKSNPSLLEGRHLEVSAHLVNHEVARDSPVLRVLFHITGIDRSVHMLGRQQALCVVLHVSFSDQSPLTTTCSPSLEDGQCLADVTIPSVWWPPLPGLEQSKPHKSPRRMVQASYYVLEPKLEYQSNDGVTRWNENCSPHLQIQPLTKIDVVPLVNARTGYRELKIDDVLFTLVPSAAVYPKSKIYVPVYIRTKLKNNIIGFIIKARSKSGLKIMDAQCRVPDNWNLSFNANHKNVAATVTVMLKNAPVSAEYNRSVTLPVLDEATTTKVEDRVDDVFSWLLEVEYDTSSEVWNEEAQIVWIVHYVMAEYEENSSAYLSDFVDNKSSDNVGSVKGSAAVAASISAPSNGKFSLQGHAKRWERIKHKITARFEVRKDITQAVLPVSKTWELINTALLTGKQVSQPMKIFVVSQSGKIADVTRQSTCHTEDDSVLKVTSSCSSIYVDGSEMRGSSNATILVKYETYTGTASFMVWMPELSELDIVISDVKLSQIYDWAVPDTTANRFGKTKRSSKTYGKLSENKVAKWQGQKTARNVNSIPADSAMENAKSSSMCKLKYQQATIDVFCRFKAIDHDTGRVSYLINRKTWLKITDLVMRGLRIADPQVATLGGRIITGNNVGRTEVQIVSPLSGRVLGYKEIRVVNDKVSITKLLVNIVSGLQLNIVPDSSGENIYIAETSITRKLSAQYQEGLLDIEIEFSDGSVTSISDINAPDYSIGVESLSPDVVAFAPMLTSIHPRVIAVGEGKGNLLKVSLLLPETCRAQAHLKDYILVSAGAFINVNFYDNEYSGQKAPMFVQNDGNIVSGGGFFGGSGRDKKRNDDTSDLQDFISGISSSSDMIKEPAVQARQHLSNKNNHLTILRRSNSHIAPMEMGVYIILATFSFAIVVFVVSCIVYASKYKPQSSNFQDELGCEVSYSSNGYKLLSNQTSSATAAVSAPSISKHTSQLPEPTTTNVHDWVWLGRATLERASGLLVPSISVHDKLRRKNNNWIRITSNPTYASELSPDVDLNASENNNNPNCNNNSNSSNNNNNNNNNSFSSSDSNRHCDQLSNVGVHHLRPRTASDKPSINSTTYNKRSRVESSRPANNRQRCFRLPTTSFELKSGYKPPVPPHRNLNLASNKSKAISEIAKSLNEAENVPPSLPHRHKHHRHHGNYHHHHHHHHGNKVPDLSSKTNTYKVSDRMDKVGVKKNEDERLEFVSCFKNLSAIKKANIVGNPMFSMNKFSPTVPLLEDTDDSCSGIEDLNLDMDYRQIMEYFDNLKESTA